MRFHVGDTVNVLRAARLPTEEVTHTGKIRRSETTARGELFWIDGVELARSADVLRLVTRGDHPTKRIVYRLEVSAAMPITDDPDDPDYHTEASATEAKHQRSIEKEIINLLKRSNFDCDVELLDYKVEEE